jgi:hypothetical protein
MAFWIPRRIAPSAAAAPVTLASFRGGGVSTAHAPAHTILDLVIDREAVPSAPEYRLEVVTASGDQVWSSPPEVSAHTLSVHLPQGLAAGSYWVRLFTRQSKILVEYGLLLE